MSRLLETIRCENGELQNLSFHQARMDASVEALFSTTNRIRLAETRVPVDCRAGLFKCRITYTKAIESIEFLPHVFPKIRSLKVVTDDSINYSHKYLNRVDLHRLLGKKGDCDDILIVKDGLLTDTSISNILLFDGEVWFTPACPLLRGTQRERLLAEKKIVAAHVTVNDLPRFEKIRIINAMIRFEDQLDLESSGIHTDPRTAGD